MQRFGKALGRVLICTFLALAAIWAFAPIEPVDQEISFKDSLLPDDIETWLQVSEQRFSDIVPGAAKRIQWAGAKGVKTPLSVIYIHGFSASAEEIRPVPDEVAQALGANLFYTRLAGHGRGSAAMAEPVAGDWLEDMAEALAIGSRLGDRVLVIATSTGATLAALAATDPALSQNLAGVVMISPNFGLNSAAARILDWPLARWWAPVVAGPTRSFTPLNDLQAKYWTTSYPTTALFPMAALVRQARASDFGTAKAPVLILYSPQDQVIDPDAIAPVAATWGGPVTLEPRSMQGDDDPYAHIIAGDVISPGQTEAVISLILQWARGL